MPDAHAPADRQLPLGARFFSTMSAHFVRDPQAAAARSRARALRPRPLSVQVNPDPAGGRAAAHRHRQRDRDVRARLYRGAVQDRRHAARPRARRRRWRAIRACISRPSRCATPPHAHRRLAAQGFRMRPLVEMQRPGRHRRRRRHRRLHGGARRGRRDAGRPHPDPHPPHRGHGLAAALALASERRARSCGRHDRGRRRGRGGAPLCALHRARGRAASAAGHTIAARPRPRSISSAPMRSRTMLPENARFHRCRSSAPARHHGANRCAALEALLSDAGLPSAPRRAKHWSRRFPEELGVGAWLVPGRIIAEQSSPDIVPARRSAGAIVCPEQS